MISPPEFSLVSHVTDRKQETGILGWFVVSPSMTDKVAMTMQSIWECLMQHKVMALIS